MSVPATGPDQPDELLTVDELAAATGTTVRNARYYAGLGLLPPPVRRGRVAYYTPLHRARLDLVRALQDHGFTLSAIGSYLERVPHDATVEDLALQRVMLTSWHTTAPVSVTKRELEDRAGRRLDTATLARLARVGAVRAEGSRFVLLPGFDTAVKLIALDLPVDSLDAADEAITRHMEALADELTEILHTKVLAPYRRGRPTEEEKARLEQKIARLRELTMEAVVDGFRRAANQVIERSLRRS